MQIPEMAGNKTIEALREEFPILQEIVSGKPLVYLDNAASTQKPLRVINAISRYYTHQNANVHRGVHSLSQKATDAFEAARRKVQVFLNAPSENEIIFTSGTTDAVNLLAQTWGRANVKTGDEIIISTMEHHSNIVPWQMLCESAGATLRVIPIDERGDIDFNAYLAMLNLRTKLLSIGHVSNALGTINPIREMIVAAKKVGAVTFIDGAQAVAHLPVDVQALDCDFYAFSGHKLYAPTGIGVLFGKEHIMNEMPPWRGGGEMIERVTFEKSTYQKVPFRFEAGTPNIAGVIGLGEAIDFLSELEMPDIQAHEQDLLWYAQKSLSEIPGLRFYGQSKNKVAVISFLLEGAHPYDVGIILDQLGVAVRTGHHCTQPLMDFYGIPGTVRASFSIYNNREDVDRLTAAVQRAAKMLA